MKRFAAVYLVLLAIWWLAISAPWVQVTGEASGTLSGTSLSGALGILPWLLLLTLFLIFYTRLRKTLITLAVASYLAGLLLSLNDQTRWPAVQTLIANQTGVSDVAGQTLITSIAPTAWPLLSALVAAIATAMLLYWLLRANSMVGRERRIQTQSDEPSLWEQTSQGDD